MHGVTRNSTNIEIQIKLNNTQHQQGANISIIQAKP
jgi:hypothetical protein